MELRSLKLLFNCIMHLYHTYNSEDVEHVLLTALIIYLSPRGR